MYASFFRHAAHGVRDLGRHPVAALMAVGSIALTVCIAFSLLSVYQVLERNIYAEQGRRAWHIYWHTGIAPEFVEPLWAEMRGLPGLLDLQTWTPEQALTDLSIRLGATERGRLAALRGQSPLPATAYVVFAAPENVPHWQEETIRYLSALPGVERIRPQRHANSALQTLWGLLQYSAAPGLAFLVLAMSFVSFGTVRLSFFSHCEEIRLLELLGASILYIRLPFTLGGALLGVFGACAGLGLFIALLMAIAPLLQGSLKPADLPLWLAACLLLFPTLAGAAGGWLAARAS